MKRALLTLFAMALMAKANTIPVGWVLERQAPVISYTTPDPDYNHFLVAVDLPLFQANELVLSIGRWDLYVPFTAFDCHCVVFDPAHRVPDDPPPSSVPEPGTAGMIAGALAGSLAASRFKERLKRDALRISFAGVILLLAVFLFYAVQSPLFTS